MAIALSIIQRCSDPFRLKPSGSYVVAAARFLKVHCGDHVAVFPMDFGKPGGGAACVHVCFGKKPWPFTFLSPMDSRLSRIRACHFVAKLVLNGESGLDQHGKLFE